jgi:diaminopropionate ammonia-lyase
MAEAMTLGEMRLVKNPLDGLARNVQADTTVYKRGMELLTEKAMDAVNAFHRSIPSYSVTPLVSLPLLAAKLGIKALYVKDESQRFGLNSFKALGCTWAMANYIAGKLGVDVRSLDFNTIVSEETRAKLGRVTFYSTTDGNHGRAVAWAARQMKQGCVIYMPNGSSQSRFENIKKEGADVTIMDMNYDDCIRYAAEQVAKDPQGVLVQDTDWPGYEEIPAHIMQGYASVSYEAYHQLQECNVLPTHIFGQAGVGSFDGSLHGFFANVYGAAAKPPVMCTVEPLEADCCARSAEAGARRTVGGDMPTIMAGLACGEPCNISWSILQRHCSYFFSIPDWVTAKGMRVLSNPCPGPNGAPGDRRIISGESGAATTGLVVTMLMNEDYRALAREIGLDRDSVVLCVSTEGDTFPEEWQQICWDGAWQSGA